MTMKSLNVRVPDKLLAALNDLVIEYDLNRSKVVRLAIWRLLNPPESYVAPTLPNWQAEAWTSLLRGLFDVEHLILSNNVRTLLESAVSALNEREAQVVNLRFGLRGRRYTQAEVAVAMGWEGGRSRAHQVEQRALRQMRRWLRSRGIWELLEGRLSEETNG